MSAPGYEAPGEERGSRADPAGDVRAAALGYVRAGLVLIPIPSGSKGRGLKRGWNLEENAIRSEEQAAQLNGCNLGLAHRWCGTCAVDVDDDRLAGPWLIKEYGIDLQALLAAPDAVQITSGRPNRAKLVYRLPADVEWLPTFNLKETHGIGLELRCATRGGAKTVQDVLPPSLHPATNRLYKWAGSGDWRRISVLPDALLRAWSELAKSQRSSRRARGRPKAPQSDTGPIREGGRNDYLTSLAGTLRQLGMEHEDIEKALLKENEERCDPRLPDHEVHTIAASVARYAPGAVATGLTDLGNAHRFARDHREVVHYCWAWRKWLVWNGRFWSPDETGEIHRLAETTVRGMYQEAARAPTEDRRKALAKWTVASEGHDRRIKMLASAQAIEGIPILPADMDRDPWLLNVRNGTIDLRVGTLRPHAREDYITRGIDVDYDPDAKCPTWDRFIAEVFGDDDTLIAFVQRAVGYSLTGDTREQVFFIPHGGGSNGKSTFLDALHNLLGPYAEHAPTTLLTARKWEQHPTELALLHGARLLTAVETGEGRQLAETLVKQLTGGDPITTRRMREDFWKYRPAFKLWLATNHKPKIQGTDHAIWRRIRLIPFEVTFHEPETGETPQKDTTLPDRLREEAAGILAWAVRGSLAWQREGLGSPEAVRKATEGYRVDMDVLGAFFEECCVIASTAEVGASELYRAYTRWCLGAGEQAETQTNFGITLRERGFRKKHGRTGDRYLGLGLTAEVV